MALMPALPEAATPALAPGMTELGPKGEKPWMRAALFGTAAELKSLPGGGLDPNSHTEGGTSLSMTAAPDPAKLKLLLDRGVNVNAKEHDPDGMGLLHMAALTNHPDAAQSLIAGSMP